MAEHTPSSDLVLRHGPDDPMAGRPLHPYTLVEQHAIDVAAFLGVLAMDTLPIVVGSMRDVLERLASAKEPEPAIRHVAATLLAWQAEVPRRVHGVQSFDSTRARILAGAPDSSNGAGANGANGGVEGDPAGVKPRAEVDRA